MEVSQGKGVKKGITRGWGVAGDEHGRMGDADREADGAVPKLPAESSRMRSFIQPTFTECLHSARHPAGDPTVNKKASQRNHSLTEGLSASAPWIFGDRLFFVAMGCPVHYRVRSSISGLYPLDASNTPFPIVATKIDSRHFPMSPRSKIPQIENHSPMVETDTKCT